MADLSNVPAGVPAQTRLKEYALLLPRLLKLVWRLARDPRVPARTKALLFMLGGYLASPIDIVPDFIPGVGQLDDIVLIAVVLDKLVNRVPREVVMDHWEGDEDILDVVSQILDISTAFLPARLRRLL
jgi:uncharacterized membrane protein YkvA (DUF1232 family)